MNDRNIGLLEEVIENRLERVLQNTTEGDQSFDEAMKAIDRQIEMLKVASVDSKTAGEIEAKSKEAENAFMKMKVDMTIAEQEISQRKKEAQINLTLKIVEIGCLLLVAPVIKYGLDAAHARYICEFEKDFTFTTTPGKALLGLFRSKK